MPLRKAFTMCLGGLLLKRGSCETMLKNEKPELQPTQNAILAAAISCVKQLGIERVTLNDIAIEAGVARSTVYSYYSNKDEVVRSALLQSAYSFVEKVFAHLDDFDNTTERIIEAVMFILRSLPDEPCLALLTDATLSKMINTHSLTTDVAIDIYISIFRFLIQDESVDDDRINEMAEFTVRTMFSLLMMPSSMTGSDDKMRGFIARWLLPPLNMPVPEQYQSVSAVVLSPISRSM